MPKMTQARTKGNYFVNGFLVFFWLVFGVYQSYFLDWCYGKLIVAEDPPYAPLQVVHEEVGVEEDEEDEHTLRSHLPPVRQSTASSLPNINPNSESHFTLCQS
jgi:hypothetical protein